MMANIDYARPTTGQILRQLDEFEQFCLGERRLSPAHFRALNEELSIGAVLMVGKRRYQKENGGKRLYWRGIDDREYDMGFINDANILRDFPGFNIKRTLSLGANQVEESKIIPKSHGKGNISYVRMIDGSEGYGPNYRLALRNAALKMLLRSKIKYFSLKLIMGKLFKTA